MAAAGHPLVGDPLYTVGGIPTATSVSSGGVAGTADVAMPGDCGYNLHSWRLTFTHPVTGERLTVVAPPPANLETDGAPREHVTTWCSSRLIAPVGHRRAPGVYLENVTILCR